MIQISRYKKDRRIIKKIVKYIGKKVLMWCDGVVPSYMNHYLRYIRFLGVMVEGKPLYICADLKIDSTDYSKITIGDGVVISSEVRFLTHDYSINKALRHVNLEQETEIRKIGRITIENDAFIGLRCTIMPDVKIGEGAIVGACSLVVRDVEPYTVVAGNPAKRIYSLDQYCEKVILDLEKNSKNYFKE